MVVDFCNYHIRFMYSREHIMRNNLLYQIYFTAIFSSLMGAFVIFFTEYMAEGSKFTSVVPGVQFVLQNIFIMSSSLVYRFGRVEDVWG